MGESWKEIGTSLGSLMFLYTLIERFFPHGFVRQYADKYIQLIVRFFNRHIQTSIDEYSGKLVDQKDQSYTFADAYLSAIAIQHALQLKVHTPKNSNKRILSMIDYEMTITDEFHGATFSWMLSNTNEIGKPRKVDDNRSLALKFLKKHRHVFLDEYLDHVMEKGKELLEQNQQRKLYTNNSRDNWYKKKMWSHVVFNHPATFDKLAMDKEKKEDSIKDLIAFSKAKDYYKKIGKAWKRGYLLYGPPGTGKSTMIAAISEYMNYDIYDLELSVHGGNSELRKLLLDTSDKSIIVIEDIDCNIALTNKRMTKKKKQSKKEKAYEKRLAEIRGDKDVTLSGLLNFIDGLWSSTGGERLIIFTTNHIEKLDPALIRRGRMDKHIELAYCSFDGFKILAENYLNIDDHPLFQAIRCKIDEARITPADVAENLMPKTINEGDHSEVCLENLITAFEKSKEDAIRLESCMGNVLIYNPSTGDKTSWIESRVPWEEKHNDMEAFYGFGFDFKTKEHKLVCLWLSYDTKRDFARF
ncbi:AAA-ATPase ASD, mitochondrial-like [Papaver somniferum]|uniref:AAA-ATPase ASD, mitochondrial-like n=1 Tax=Papaver somniferum TaxID=3469 RepID=UPI000E70243C|nr:AAA-ATPase ASD, mitochondrial-like [Papaver somniferum]